MLNAAKEIMYKKLNLFQLQEPDKTMKKLKRLFSYRVIKSVKLASFLVIIWQKNIVFATSFKKKKVI